MSRPPRPAHLPVKGGVSASCVAVNGGPWPTVLDFLAARLPVLGRATWAERLATGDVLDAQGQPVSAEQRPTPGQRLFYYRQLPHEPEPAEPERIVFQDDWLVVADKPHFMPVVPTGRYVRRSLLVRLKHRLGLPDLSPVHRIDRETAGLVVFAVQPATRDAYQALFRMHQVDKLYEAVAPHRPELPLPPSYASRLEPDPDPARFFVSCEAPGAPNSLTHLACAQVLGEHALYHLRPVTGRRHQLRLHLQALGRPIVGDAFYPVVRRGPGEPDDDDGVPLQLLARALAFDDPVTGARRAFTSARTLAAAARAQAA